MNALIRFGAVALSTLALSACGGGETASTTPGPDKAPDKPTLKVDKGVDLASKTIKIGTLNDESGPAAAIGKPFANGKRLLAAHVNAGGSGLLPDGWKVELIERDHGYNPQQSVQAYNEIKDEVLFIGTSFGTPNTLPLQPHLETDKLVAYPASLSSEMAKHNNTPPLGPSYTVEAMRAFDWAVEHKGGTDFKAGIVYQQDDYGKDGLDGWKQAAAHHGVEIVAEQTVAPGQKDMAAVITGLKDAGADVVLLTTLPSGTGPILGTAAQLGYMPTWIGNTPAWIDAFYNPEVIPPVVFTNYHQANGLPFWGEQVAGMDAFTKAWETHGKEMGNQDGYILLSYIQGMAQLEAARRSIGNMDLTREGYLTSLHTIDKWDANGMIQPISLTAAPYSVSDHTRVLKPEFDTKSWSVVADYAAPKTLDKGQPALATEAAPADNAEPGTVGTD